MRKSFFLYLYILSVSVQYDGFVFRYQKLHDAPADKVSNGTDAEYDEVSGCLAFESHEYHLGFISVSKQCARTFVDEERAAIPPNPVMVATALFGNISPTTE